ncbi:MAG: TonB-dependent receptor [Bryobacteraceae bacterium]
MFVFVAALLSAGAVLAQSAGNSSELSGAVTDPSGGRIAGASVALRNPLTGFNRSAITNLSGEYRLLLVPPGTYELRVEKQDFRPRLTPGIVLTIGQAATLDVALELGGGLEVIEVSAAPALVESERTSQSNTMQQMFVRDLPIDRRDYLSFTLLAPGVVDSGALADNSDFRVAATPTSGLSFYGSNGRGNSITVDGGGANDDAGGVRPTLSQEAVQEFQINRSGYTAELGGASGGVINIVSKGGGNDIHGSAFAFFRHQSLDAGDPFARVLEADGSLRRVKPDSKRQQAGFSIGGPLLRDRAFYFGAFEALNRDESNVVSVLTDRSIFGPTREQEAILARLPTTAAGQLRAALSSPPATIALFEQNSGVTPFSSNDYKGSLRVDHAASPADQLFLRANFAWSKDTNASARALVGSSRGNDIRYWDNTLAAGWTKILSGALFNDLRVMGNYNDQTVSSLEPFGPELNINGFGFFNKDIFLPNVSLTKKLEIRETVSGFRGGHGWKAGAMLNLRQDRSDTQTFFGGRFTFGPLPGSLVSAALGSTSINALQAFNLGLPQFYQQGFGDPVVSAVFPYYGFFVQDSWKVSRRLKLDLGLRYDIDTRKSPLPTDKNNFAPRFGFSFDPVGDGRTSLRGGYGIFYSPIYFQIDYVVNALGLIDGHRQISQVFTTIQTAGAASAANIFRTLRAQGVIAVPTPSRRIAPEDLTQFGLAASRTRPTPPFSVLFENSPDYVNPYSQQASLGIERQVGPDIAIGVSGIYVRTLKIGRARDTNLLAAPVDPQLGIRVWRTQDFANPLLFQRNVYESTARSFYAGLILEARKRFSRSLSLAANYTFSKATDEVTDYNSDFQAFDQTNLRAERALSAFDQRHKAVVYGVWEALGGVQFSPIFRANSGRPFNLLAGADLNQDRHPTTDRPIGAGRNTGLGHAFYTFDARISKHFPLGDARRLTLLIEGFNLTNHLNYASINNTVGPIQGPFNLQGRHDRSPSEPLGFTSAFDTRRLQLGIRLSF